MTVGQIRNEIMFQTNNDVDDLGDFMPYLMDYINEGYDRLMYAFAECHVGPDDCAPLQADADVPILPEWTHRALADWATWLVYRNGNPQKQNRGFQFRTAFDEILGKLIAEGGRNGKVKNFFNIPY